MRAVALRLCSLPASFDRLVRVYPFRELLVAGTDSEQGVSKLSLFRRCDIYVGFLISRKVEYLCHLRAGNMHHVICILLNHLL